MRMRIVSTFVATFALSFGLLLPVGGPSPAAAQDKVLWNISLWGTPRAVTRSVEWVRDHLKEQTNGKFELKIHYGEAISGAKENLDGLKINAFHGAQFCASYHPGKNPVMTGLDLPFLPLPSFDVTKAVHEDYFKHPAAVEELARWNAMAWHSTALPQFEFMGHGKPPLKLEDWKGMRVRALGGLGEAMKEMGAIPTSVPAPEVYGGLERGIFHAVSFPFSFAFAAYRLHEVSKWYTTNMATGTIGCPYIVNKTAFEKLPAEWQAMFKAANTGAYDVLKRVYQEDDEKNVPMFRARGLREITYTPAELERFKEAGAKPVWDRWVKEMTEKGLPGQALLDHIMTSAKRAVGS
jgi:TRAP-type C4-dicarboxylate transport system substrate-binding protein